MLRVSHGGLLDGLEGGVYGDGDTTGLGSRRLDLIQGPITGPAAPDAMSAEGVHVAESFEPTRWWPGHTVLFQHTFRNVRAPFYARLRGTDGNRHTSAGLGPLPDIIGDSDPFKDLWCYTNPVFVDVW